MAQPNSTRWRIIACDLDGTLIGRGEKPDPADLAALSRARDAGLHVAICTGRNSLECAGVIDALHLQGLGVFANGAAVCDMPDGKIVQPAYFLPPLVDAAVDFFGNRGHAVLTLIDDPHTRLPRYVLSNHAPAHRATQEWLLLHRTSSHVAANLAPADRDCVLRLGIVVNADEKHAIEIDLANTLGQRITWHSVYSHVFDCQIIEAFAPGVNKWTGVLRLCNAMAIDPQHVVTIGDDVNDIAMLREASLSFAMGNASEVIRKIAKQVTASQSNHGVAQAINGILDAKWESTI